MCLVGERKFRLTVGFEPDQGPGSGEHSGLAWDPDVDDILGLELLAGKADCGLGIESEGSGLGKGPERNKDLDLDRGPGLAEEPGWSGEAGLHRGHHQQSGSDMHEAHGWDEGVDLRSDLGLIAGSDLNEGTALEALASRSDFDLDKGFDLDKSPV